MQSNSQYRRYRSKVKTSGGIRKTVVKGVKPCLGFEMRGGIGRGELRAVLEGGGCIKNISFWPTRKR